MSQPLHLSRITKTFGETAVLGGMELDIEAGEYRLKHDNAIHFDAYRFESLEYFYGLGARAQIREAA